MPHPVHELLKRYLDFEQCAFDASQREYWPAEHEARNPQGRRRSYRQALARAAYDHGEFQHQV